MTTGIVREPKGALRIKAVALLLVATALGATDAPRPVRVKVLGEHSSPVHDVDVVLCPGGGARCTQAATTDREGIAHFASAPRGLIAIQTIGGPCRPARALFDLGARESTDPLILQLPATSTLRVRVAELVPGDMTRPLRTKEITITLHRSPPIPNAVGAGRIQQSGLAPTDRFDVCLEPRTGYDIEVEIPGFYLGSTHVDALEPFATKEARLTVRGKPKP
jgi:hypothetical protein